MSPLLLTRLPRSATAVLRRGLASAPAAGSARPPSYEESLRLRREVLGPGLITYYSKPLYVTRGSGQWLWDDKGTRYLDMFGGICTVSVGHCHPKVNAALADQSSRLWHTTNIYMSPMPQVYAKKLVAKLPPSLSVCYFANSGSEANDLAVLMARLHTKRWEVLTLRNGYHGGSPFLMGATALSSWRFSTPTGFGFVNSVNADPYRGEWGGAACRDSMAQPDRKCGCEQSGECCAAAKYADQLDDALRFSCPKAGPAAFLAESMQGVGGMVQFPRGFLARAFASVRAAGGLCISDEVQTGFGRLGSHYWGFETHGVVPDIVTMAKSIGNGFPLAAVVTSPEVAQTLTEALHFNTFGGNPLACAVGSAVLDAIDDEKLQENCSRVGARLMQGLIKLRDSNPLVGDVRGKGLMVGVELVSDKAARTPLEPQRMSAVFEATREAGVLMGKGGFYGNVLRLQPPMCITEGDADTAISAIAKALGAAA